jgi:transcriptional regulator with XRE-family HTH domain
MAVRAEDLATFLRARREHADPALHGLPAHRRRTPGLRREEVAVLAHVSVSYYTALEQGRGAQPSAEITDALATALALDDTARTHLHTLAGTVPSAPPRTEPGAGTRDLVRRTVTALDPDPAYATDARWSLIAANPAAVDLFGSWIAGPEANMLRFMLIDPAARDLFRDWEQESRAQLARYRATSAHRPGDPLDRAFLDALCRDSDLARQWWPAHDVAPVGGGVKRLRRPGGDEDRPYQVWMLAEDPDVHLVTFPRPH